jgi:predicted DNA-binding transcriptional regulator AlpA
MDTPNNEILTIDDLPVILKMNKRTIQNRISRDLPLPPSFKIPESKMRLWRRSDVTAWINAVADEYIQQEEARREQLEELTSIAQIGRMHKKTGK